MMVWVPMAVTSTKPVRNVPASPPAVPAADRPPNTVPVSSRLPSRSFATIGVAAASAVAGAKNASAARTSVAPLPSARLGPSARTMGTDSHTSAPPTTSDGPSIRRGLRRSASLPPAAAPVAIPASTTPMIAVKVSSDTPT